MCTYLSAIWFEIAGFCFCSISHCIVLLKSFGPFVWNLVSLAQLKYWAPEVLHQQPLRCEKMDGGCIPGLFGFKHFYVVVCPCVWICVIFPVFVACNTISQLGFHGHHFRYNTCLQFSHLHIDSCHGFCWVISHCFYSVYQRMQCFKALFWNSSIHFPLLHESPHVIADVMHLGGYINISKW